MLKLFYVPSTCALASHIALEDAGATYEAVRLDFAKEDQLKPEFLAINPKARVPALVTNQGILTETPAILAFIAQSFPDAALAPLNDTKKSPFARLWGPHVARSRVNSSWRASRSDCWEGWSASAWRSAVSVF